MRSLKTTPRYGPAMAHNEPSPDDNAFLRNVLNLQGFESKEIWPGHTIRSATDLEAAEIRHCLARVGGPRTVSEFSGSVCGPPPGGRVERLPDGEYRYFVMAFRGSNATMNALARTLEPTGVVTLQAHCSSHPFGYWRVCRALFGSAKPKCTAYARTARRTTSDRFRRSNASHVSSSAKSSGGNFTQTVVKSAMENIIIPSFPSSKTQDHARHTVGSRRLWEACGARRGLSRFCTTCGKETYAD